MKNENCLAGMRCQCGSYGPFEIYGECSFLVTDDGAEQTGDVAWDDDSYCFCRSCLRNAEVRDFQEGE